MLFSLLYALVTLPILALACASKGTQALAKEKPKIYLKHNACYEGSWLETNTGNQYASFQGEY